MQVTAQEGRTSVAVAPAGFVGLVFATGLLLLGIGVIAPVIPLYATRFDVSNTTVAVLLSSFAAGRLLFTIPGGVLLDRSGFRVVTVAASVLATLVALAAAWFQVFWVLLVALFLQGAASAVYTTAATVALTMLTEPAHLGRILARYQGSILLTMALSPVVGGAVAELLGTAGPFWVCVLGGAAATVLSMTSRIEVLPREQRDESVGPLDAPVASLRSLAFSRPFMLSLLAAFAAAWAMAGVRNTLVPIAAADGLLLSAGVIGAVLTAGGIANMAAVVPGGRVLDSQGRRPVIRWGGVMLAVTTLGFLAATDLATLLVATLIAGAAKGFLNAAPALVAADVAPPRHRGTMVGMSQAAASSGLMVGPVMVAWLADALGARAAFIASAAFLGALSLLTARMPETRRGR